MSSSNNIHQAMPPAPGQPGFHAPASPEMSGQGLKHELVDAQVEALRMYLEKRPAESFAAALDRLIACAGASFRAEEEFMSCLAPNVDPAHRKQHDAVIAQLESLRARAHELDRGRMLALLIVVDRQLTSHIAGADQAPEYATTLAHH